MAGESVFRFAELELEQSEQVHKIGTDAVALATRVEAEQAKTLLDIGCGTGILVLVLLKRYSQLYAVAIDPSPSAAALTQRNASQNQLQHRCFVEQVTLDEYRCRAEEKFDCIISNPPYFAESTTSPISHRSSARSQSALSPTQFMHGCSTLLKPQGRLWVILPDTQVQRYVEQAGLYGLYFNLISTVLRPDGQPTGRVILSFSRNAIEFRRESYHLPDAPMYRIF